MASRWRPWWGDMTRLRRVAWRRRCGRSATNTKTTNQLNLDLQPRPAAARAAYADSETASKPAVAWSRTSKRGFSRAAIKADMASGSRIRPGSARRGGRERTRRVGAPSSARCPGCEPGPISQPVRLLKDRAARFAAPVVRQQADFPVIPRDDVLITVMLARHAESPSEPHHGRKRALAVGLSSGGDVMRSARPPDCAGLVSRHTIAP